MVEANRPEGQSRTIRPEDLRSRNGATPRRDRSAIGTPDATQVLKAAFEFQPRTPGREELAALKNEDGELELPSNYRRGRYLDLLA